jgi:hypothetical protein
MRKRALGHSTRSKANSPAKSCPRLGPIGYLESILAQPTLKNIQHLHRKLVHDVTSIGDSCWVYNDVLDTHKMGQQKALQNQA